MANKQFILLKQKVI